MESEETAEKKLEAKKKTSLYFRPRVRAQLHAHRRFTFPLSRLLSGLFLPPLRRGRSGRREQSPGVVAPPPFLECRRPRGPDLAQDLAQQPLRQPAADDAAAAGQVAQQQHRLLAQQGLPDAVVARGDDQPRGPRAVEPLPVLPGLGRDGLSALFLQARGAVHGPHRRRGEDPTVLAVLAVLAGRGRGGREGPGVDGRRPQAPVEELRLDRPQIERQRRLAGGVGSLARRGDERGHRGDAQDGGGWR